MEERNFHVSFEIDTVFVFVTLGQYVSKRACKVTAGF